MATEQREFTIDPNDIVAALRRHVETFTPTTEQEEVGRVVEVKDAVATIEGLPRTMANELLEFPSGVLGLALNLDVDSLGVVVLGDASEIEEGDAVKQTGRILSVPVGDAFLGRVIDPLGRPEDGKGPIQAETTRALEIQAASVVQRQPVKEPLQTGIKAIDAMTAIGRGQRQLIIGDRQTGKTAVAVDAIINQRENWASGDPKQQVRCIYVAIGQKSSTVREVQQALIENGAMDFTVIINAPASSPAAFQYIAPYAGAALGAHWMYEGQHALVVYDDLSKQANAYRSISLQLRRPPGREAYPGDVFYLHSRLLERAAKLSDDLGGGSLTALPLIETKGGDVSAYIPTNVISITDGQIYLEKDLFNAGVRPAINVGISVSRVGGNAQIKAMKQVAGRLRLDLAQYRELEAFAGFGSELDKASQQQLARGARVVEILKQPQYTPMRADRQVVSIYAVTGGFIDPFPVEDAKRFERELLQYVETRHGEILDHIRTQGTLPEDVEGRLRSAIEEFARGFQPSEAPAGSAAAAGQGSAPDEVRPDVGWDRMSSVDDEEDEGPDAARAPQPAPPQPHDTPTQPQDGATQPLHERALGEPDSTEADEARVERQAGPASDTDAPPVP